MKNLQVIEQKNLRVLTTQQLADSYESDEIKIQQNFNNNKERYQEGIHYFKLEGQEKRDFINHTKVSNGSKNAQYFYLWTEKGSLLHAKSLSTDKAWAVYEMLVDTYFRAKELFQVPRTKSEALRLAADLEEQLEKQKPLVAFAETVARSEDSILVRELAKLCCDKGVKIGQNRLYSKLREWGLIFKKSTEPKQEYVERDYFEVSESAKETSKGVKIFKTTRIKPKGQIYIVNRLKEEV